VAAATVACGGGPLTEGESAFRAGRYPPAKQTFASLEGESPGWDLATRAEYALYRGLTLAALGDQGHAAPWLDYAKAVEDARPGTLRDEDARRLAVERDANPPR